jgi:hypothetical protein
VPFNVLLLPLLGGYLFISHWNFTRFDANRYSGERLLFHSATAGVIFLTASFCMTSIIVSRYPAIGTWWEKLVPFEYSGTSLLAFAAGALVWYPLNKLKWFQREKQARKTIERWSDFLEVMLEYAQRELKLVSVVLNSRKVYIGFVTGSFDPMNERDYIQLLPSQSGYRDFETLQLKITTDYSIVYNRIVRQEIDIANIEMNDFRIVLPVSEITSINLFDEETFVLFNPPQPEQTASPTKPPEGSA